MNVAGRWVQLTGSVEAGQWYIQADRRHCSQIRERRHPGIRRPRELRRSRKVDVVEVGVDVVSQPAE